MPDERSKYDTDPLDPDFVRRTEEIGGATRDVSATPNERARQHKDSEAPTRLFQDSREPLSYPSVFVAPPAADLATERIYEHAHTDANHHHAAHNHAAHAGDRRTPFAEQQAEHERPPHRQPPSPRVVRGIGLPENLLVIAPYAPLFVGAIAAIVELLLVPRDERRVRFHAAQGLALHGAALAGAILLRLARMLAVFAFGDFAAGLLSLVWIAFFVISIVFFIQAMTRVWRGEGFHIEAVGDATRLLDEQIKPRA